ncbi:hypothetical protein [Hoyosella altamirensis]|uniref:Uncharacterized protein n=1 Tax=Hoyosella altamirensis TaxID=616997 RepID=A0A839RQ60_9ACTN|nr:hypothetical protein [Hoyosella altamirensis]MBB3038254.1 hypothetical protein [Hoyosella altamirensis]
MISSVEVVTDVWAQADPMVLMVAAGVLALCASVATWGVATDERWRSLWLMPFLLIVAGGTGFVAAVLFDAGSLLPGSWPVLPELSALVAFAAVPATAFVLVTTQSTRIVRAVAQASESRDMAPSAS